MSLIFFVHLHLNLLNEDASHDFVVYSAIRWATSPFVTWESNLR